MNHKGATGQVMTNLLKTGRPLGHARFHSMWPHTGSEPVLLFLDGPPPKYYAYAACCGSWSTPTVSLRRWSIMLRFFSGLSGRVFSLPQACVGKERRA